MTDRPKHTPGTWRLDGLSIICARSSRNGDYAIPIAEVDGEDPNCRANARLIAAAPEMLAALEAQEMAEADKEASQRKGYFDRARELRAAALAKVRGW